jgi:hypothetical protein
MAAVVDSEPRQRTMSMSADELERAFAKAAEIASKLPSNLQESAFNRALDELLGRQSGPSSAASTRLTRTTQSRAPQATPQKATGDALSGLLAAIDRTKYSDVGATSRVADRALKVLQLVNSDHGVDGLTATEIAEILTKKLRLPVKTHAIRMALIRETDTVDVRPRADGKRVFHIMEPGEEYLSRLRSGKGEAAVQTTQARRRRPTRRSPPASAKEDELAAPRTGSTSRRAGTGRPGPKTAIAQLIAAGYFASPRLISHVQDELKHKRGHQYSLQDLSPTLVRCLREGLLKRDRNEEGQYEYSQA